MSKRDTHPVWRSTVILAIALCLVACSLSPEKKIVGEWQTGQISHFLYDQKQYEFLKDGTVAVNGRMRTRQGWGPWDQFAAGTFRFSDPTHIKIDLGWFYGTTVYEVKWRDSDHITLAAGGDTLELVRVK